MLLADRLAASLASERMSRPLSTHRVAEPHAAADAAALQVLGPERRYITLLLAAGDTNYGIEAPRMNG